MSKEKCKPIKKKKADEHEHLNRFPSAVMN